MLAVRAVSCTKCQLYQFLMEVWVVQPMKYQYLSKKKIYLIPDIKTVVSRATLWRRGRKNSAILQLILLYDLDKLMIRKFPNCGIRIQCSPQSLK